MNLPSMKLPSTGMNIVAAVCLSILFAIMYRGYAPPEWAWVGTTMLFATIVYFYCSLVDVIREYGVHNAK